MRAGPLDALDGSPELLQSGYWAAFKSAHGWQAHPFLVTCASAAGKVEFPLLVLTRRIARVFRLAYVPFGPTYDPGPGRGVFLQPRKDRAQGLKLQPLGGRPDPEQLLCLVMSLLNRIAVGQ